MKGRAGGSAAAAAPTDLLVCFPSRAHLTLMPKRICSPSRPNPNPNEQYSKRQPTKQHSNRGRSSPLFRTKANHHIRPDNIGDEPTSPKVTCAGQIKVKPKPKSTPRGGNNKDWFSVMEEIERLHEHKKKPNWLEALGIKKEVTNFLGALRFNMRCFGSFRGATIDYTTEDDDDDDNQPEEERDTSRSAPRTIFSKWFMVLEENDKKEAEEETEEEEEEGDGSSAPPPNALLLMRCRSAPAKGWLDGDGEDGAGGGGDENELQKTREDEEKERMVLMSYAPDFFKVSTDIAKETWVVGAVDPLVRCRSWKR